MCLGCSFAFAFASLFHFSFIASIFYSLTPPSFPLMHCIPLSVTLFYSLLYAALLLSESPYCKFEYTHPSSSRSTREGDLLTVSSFVHVYVLLLNSESASEVVVLDVCREPSQCSVFESLLCNEMCVFSFLFSLPTLTALPRSRQLSIDSGVWSYRTLASDVALSRSVLILAAGGGGPAEPMLGPKAFAKQRPNSVGIVVDRDDHHRVHNVGHDALPMATPNLRSNTPPTLLSATLHHF